jgi:hypothetical protein
MGKSHPPLIFEPRHQLEWRMLHRYSNDGAFAMISTDRSRKISLGIDNEFEQ